MNKSGAAGFAAPNLTHLTKLAGHVANLGTVGGEDVVELVALAEGGRAAVRDQGDVEAGTARDDAALGLPAADAVGERPRAEILHLVATETMEMRFLATSAVRWSPVHHKWFPKYLHKSLDKSFHKASH